MNDDLDRFVRALGDELGRAEKRSASTPRIFTGRRLAIVGVVLTLVVAGAVVALPGTDRGGSTASAVERAKAALSTENAIVHFETVTRSSSDADPYELRSRVWMAPDAVRFTDDSGTTTGEDEIAVRWYPLEPSTDGKMRARFESFDRERNVLSYYWTRLPRNSMAFDLDPAAPIRRLLASGEVKDEGVVTLNGREARKLVSRTEATPPTQTGPNSGIAGQQAAVIEYYVDAKTFEPIRTRNSVGDPAHNEWVVSDFGRIERLPLSAETRKLLKIDAPADAKRVDKTDSFAKLFTPR